MGARTAGLRRAGRADGCISTKMVNPDGDIKNNKKQWYAGVCRSTAAPRAQP